MIVITNNKVCGKVLLTLLKKRIIIFVTQTQKIVEKKNSEIVKSQFQGNKLKPIAIKMEHY